jgi:hypothetical protein
MGKLIANTDYTLTATPLGSWVPGGPQDASDATLTQQQATQLQCNGKPVLINEISWFMITGACTFAGHTHVGGSSVPVPAPGFANATPVKATTAQAKADTIKLLRQDDIGKCNGTFTNNSTGATVPCQCEFKITNAGQNKARAE